jgi:hypothetical protein
MAYCAETDPQASRLFYILSTFRDVVVQQRERRDRQQQQANQLPPVHLKAHINPYIQTTSFTPTTSTVSHIAPQLPSLPPSFLSSPVHIPSSFSGFSQTSTQQQHSPPNTTMSPNAAAYSSLSSPPTVGAVKSPMTSRPIEPALTPSAPPNPLSPNAPGTPINGPSLDRHINLSGLLDLSALVPDRISLNEGSEGQDEHIDFDALWAWPSNTSAVDTPRPSGSVGENAVQGISDSSVPLFGVMEG